MYRCSREMKDEQREVNALADGTAPDRRRRRQTRSAERSWRWEETRAVETNPTGGRRRSGRPMPRAWCTDLLSGDSVDVVCEAAAGLGEEVGAGASSNGAAHAIAD